jgi:hypothetical protein
MTIALSDGGLGGAKQIVKRRDRWSSIFPFTSMTVAAGKHRLRPISAWCRCELTRTRVVGLLPLADV